MVDLQYHDGCWEFGVSYEACLSELPNGVIIDGAPSMDVRGTTELPADLFLSVTEQEYDF